MNNLAMLIPVDIDLSILKNEWIYQYQLIKDTKIKPNNVYKTLDIFTGFFKNLLEEIIEVVDLPPQDYMIQYHDINHNSKRNYLTGIHRDTYRKTCITLPIEVNEDEPICFYDEVPLTQDRRLDQHTKPNLESSYSKQHPTLVNVSNLHNIRIINDMLPRILLQINYNYDFIDIIKHKKDIWEIITKNDN
jgi:hypothetical protein